MRATFLLFLFLLIVGITSTDYGIVVDAGSSSSKLLVYSWEDVNDITQIFHLQAKPGLHKLVHNLTEIEKQYKYLLDEALKYIPKNKVSKTPLWLGATAGLRTLNGEEAEKVIEKVREVVSKNYDFYYQKRNIKILSGEEEGTFGWIQVQYTLKNKYTDTVGALDLGGASTQISFIPNNVEIIGNKVSIEIEGSVQDIYTHSYLSFGQDKALDLSFKVLKDKYPEQAEINHPCLFKGWKETRLETIFNGTQEEEQCKQLIYDMLHLNSYCFYGTCGFNSEYIPKITNEKFIAFSGYSFVLLGLKKQDGEYYKISEIKSWISDFCSNTYEWALENSGLEKPYIAHQCFVAHYAMGLLTDGYNIDENTNQVMIANKLDGKTMGWTIGMLLNEKKYVSFFNEEVNEYYYATVALSVLLFFFMAFTFILIITNSFFIFMYCKKPNNSGKRYSELD